MKTRPGSSFSRSRILVTALAVLVICRVQAQITVTTANDENNTPAGAAVSLREALRESVNGGQISFDATLNGKVLWLGLGEMVVTGKSVAVIAPPGFVIGAGGRSRIFRVDAGAGLNLSGATLQDGYSASDGGAILSAGILSLTDCVLRDNRVSNGTAGTNAPPGNFVTDRGGTGGTGSNGGAISSTGSLTVLRCYFSGNKAGNGGTGGTGGMLLNPTPLWDGGPGGFGGQGGHGGAINSTGYLQLTECVFELNQSGVGGDGGDVGSPQFGNAIGGRGGNSGNGGAVAQDGDCTIERCTFSGNNCPRGGLAGPKYSNQKTKEPPGSSGNGGALYWLSGGAATLTNCTIAGNSTDFTLDSNLGGAVGAGSGGSLKLVHCTIVNNGATGSYWKDNTSPPYYGAYVGTYTAAGIASYSAVQCSNCIISQNRVTRYLNPIGASSEEINFSTNTARTVIPFGPFGGTPGGDAMLSSLALTSGPLPVLVPATTSPAVDAGALISTPPATDQRGLPRTGVPDLGAVELQPVESPLRFPQYITFSPAGYVQSATVNLSATATSGLPVVFEVAGGPASVSGNVLTFSGPGVAYVRALQPGDGTRAPALPVVRRIEATHFISFTPPANYIVYPGSQTTVTLPATTSAGLAVSWSFVGTPGAGATLSGNRLTATSPGTVQIRGQNVGNAQYYSIELTWTLTFILGAIWWETPAIPAGWPAAFTFVEGSPHGLNMTARLSPSDPGPVPVPPVPGITATPSTIPPGVTSLACLLTLPANPAFSNQTMTVTTGISPTTTMSFFLINRQNVPMDVFAPAQVMGGTSAAVVVSCPGVAAPGASGPPPDLGVREVTVSAADFDNPAVPVAVALESVTNSAGPYPRKNLRIAFPAVNGRVRLTVTTDDGITGHTGPVQILADTNEDGDGVNDIVEAALQRAPGLHHPPPIVIQQENDGLHAVLGNRPRNLQGWSVVIELSTNLHTWTPAPAGSITVTPNLDGTTETVSVLLPASPGTLCARLRASLP